MTKADKEKHILDNINLVKHIVSKYHHKNIGIEYEDLISYGTMGLIDAANKYDASKNCQFSTYATLKIKAFIIDEIRRRSPISRKDISEINKYKVAIKELQDSLLREPTELEITRHMTITAKQLRKIQNNIHVMMTISLDAIIFEGNNDVNLVDTIKEDEMLAPDKVVEDEEKLEILSRAINLLKERDKLILSLYYYEELTLKEIGAVLEVSESRVSQLHSRAIINLRNIIENLNYSLV